MDGFKSISETIPEGDTYATEDFQKWWQRWLSRLKKNSKPMESAFSLMRANNPAVIPRNHQVEKALPTAEEQGDFSKIHTLLEILSEPYLDNPDYKEFQKPPKPEERVYQTFCGT